MFNSSITQLFKPSSDGRYSDMDNMDMMLNYENNEFMSSEFFDTIRSVENGIQDDLLNSGDELLTSSDTSSHIDGYISPRNDISESERSSIFTEDSVSPLRTVEAIDESLFDFLQPVQNSFEIDPTPVIINPPKTSKIIIQNPTVKKIINKPVINNASIKKIGKKQILKVQSLGTNGKSVILPYGLKSIKILNASDLKSDRIQLATLPTSTVCRRKVEPTSARHRDDNDSNVPINELTEVKLTSEEKRLLDKEGIQLPAYHPLTKMEDRELKRIRRKIRNKISAQDSRKRKKEYVDGLEERVRRGSEENRNLLQRVRELQKKNKTLMEHINKLQSLIFNSSSSKATPSTCLMIVMLSVLLVSLPNIRLPHNKELSTDQEQVTISRSLLSTQKVEEDGFNMEDFFVFNKDDESLDNENNTEEIFKTIEEMENKYNSMHIEKNTGNSDNFLNNFMTNVKRLFSSNEIGSYFNSDYGGYNNKRGFIEPDIDDFEPTSGSINIDEPPSKKMKLVDEHYHQNDENFVPFNRNKVVSATVQTNSNLGESMDK